MLYIIDHSSNSIGDPNQRHHSIHLLRNDLGSTLLRETQSCEDAAIDTVDVEQDEIIVEIGSLEAGVILTHLEHAVG